MDAMDRIRAERGLMSRIAEGIGVTRGAVNLWKRVPAARVADVARITGIPAEELRPDLAAQFRPAGPPAEAA